MSIVRKALGWVIGTFFEPAGFALKCIGLAVFLSQPDWSRFAFFIVTTLVLIPSLNMANLHVSGFRSLRELYERIRKDVGGVWARNTALSNQDLLKYFDFLQLNSPRRARSPNTEEALFFLYRSPPRGLPYRCYFNMMGASFIETPGPIKSLAELPPGKRFLVYHELGHANFAGNEVWSHSRLSAVMWCITAVVLVVIMKEFGYAHAIVTALALIIAIANSSRIARNNLAEKIADYQAYRLLFRESPKDALAVGEALIEAWSDELKANPGAAFTIKPRIETMQALLAASEKLQRGENPIDPVNVHPVVRFPHEYILGLVIGFLCFGSVRNEAIVPLSFVFGAIIIFVHVFGGLIVARARIYERGIIETVKPDEVES